MALAPFDTQLVVARLATNVGDADGQWRKADFAADNATALANRTMPMPSVYVLEPSFSALDQNGQGAAWGLVSVTQDYEVGVLTCVQNFAGDTGKLQSQAAQVLRTQLWQLMVGWSPEEEGFVFDLNRGTLLDFDDLCFFYLDVFSLRRISRNN